MAADYSGPRRARVELMADGRQLQTFVDTGETVVRDPTAQPTSSSPFDRERQRAIILQAANSVNLFVKPVTFSDEAAIRAQKVKTWIYIPAVAILSVILVLFYLIQKQTIRLSPAINTYADYQAIAGFEPSCPCSHAPKVQDAVQLVIGTSSNFSVNACGSLMNMYVDCYLQGNSSVDAGISPCTQSPAAGAFARAILPMMADSCRSMRNAQVAVISNFYSTSIGADLLDPPSLQALVDATAVTELQKIIMSAGSLLSPLTMAWHTMAPTSFELTEGVAPADRSPFNCTCSNSTGQLVRTWGPLSTCRFKMPFDNRPENESALAWNCFPGDYLANFPLALLDDHLFALLGLPQDSAGTWNRYHWANGSYTNFQGLMGAIAAEFADPLATTLADGVAITNHEAYFAACAPHSCVYTITDRPSFIQGLTTALGVISGLQAFLLLIVDRGVDYWPLVLLYLPCAVWSRTHRRQSASRKMAGRSGAAADENGGATGVETVVVPNVMQQQAGPARIA